MILNTQIYSNLGILALLEVPFWWSFSQIKPILILKFSSLRTWYQIGAADHMQRLSALGYPWHFQNWNIIDDSSTNGFAIHHQILAT